jgi:hypothetical protein
MVQNIKVDTKYLSQKPKKADVADFFSDKGVRISRKTL